MSDPKIAAALTKIRDKAKDEFLQAHSVVEVKLDTLKRHQYLMVEDCRLTEENVVSLALESAANLHDLTEVCARQLALYQRYRIADFMLSEVQNGGEL